MSYYQISATDLGKESKIPILKLGDSAEVFYEIAMMMIQEIQKNNAQGKKTVMIVPVGPVGQYPIFVRLVNRERVSLKNVWFFNMDEYLGEDGNWIDENHKLSFRGYMNREVYGKIDADLVMPLEQRIFPHPKNPERIGELLKELGGVDVTFGGIGINGHLAFNEPEPGQTLTAEEFAELPTRVLKINKETLTVNSVADMGGAVEAMPNMCVTIGMKEILSARRAVFGVFRDWHRAVIRQAAYGEVSAKFPATLLQSHPDALIIANENASKQAY